MSLPSVLHGLMYHTRPTVLHPQATTALLAALASVKGMSNLPLLGVLPCVGVVLFWSSFMPWPSICLGFSVANWYSNHSHIYFSLAPHAEGGIQGLVQARQELYH